MVFRENISFELVEIATRLIITFCLDFYIFKIIVRCKAQIYDKTLLINLYDKSHRFVVTNFYFSNIKSVESISLHRTFKRAQSFLISSTNVSLITHSDLHFS